MDWLDGGTSRMTRHETDGSGARCYPLPPDEEFLLRHPTTSNLESGWWEGALGGPYHVYFEWVCETTFTGNVMSIRKIRNFVYLS